MNYLELFLTFLKIGAFTFGGGYAMLPLIQGEVVSHGWLSMEEMIDFIAVSESTPGPFAVNVSTYVGMAVGGVFGAFLATLGVVLPSFVIILIVAKFFVRFQKNETVKGVMSGLRPAVIGLVAAAVFSTFMTVFFQSGFSLGVLSERYVWISAIVIAVLVFLSIKRVHPILIIAISGVTGILMHYLIN